MRHRCPKTVALRAKSHERICCCPLRSQRNTKNKWVYEYLPQPFSCLILTGQRDISRRIYVQPLLVIKYTELRKFVWTWIHSVGQMFQIFSYPTYRTTQYRTTQLLRPTKLQTDTRRGFIWRMLYKVLFFFFIVEGFSCFWLTYIAS